MNLPEGQYIDYQLTSNWYVLEGKSETSIPEKYYIFKDKDGHIQAKIIFDIDNKKPNLSKDLLVTKNNHMRNLTHSIKIIVKKLMAE
ncbi:hypothetical protein ABLB69_18470 [Xenorhabdus khoisanae]|uniref:Uncharacterized protein n=1 Tax=Xenorhabdus khoisanae TaxID=880157 RepID=A0A0J5IUM7_9GAMM|nr:hypothetical protein [Xenorhabdus khoisanae]KMJ46860.1 hypothetical protein AB204_01255 [Xenorhabdus khoisanae]MDC9612411.1 hypothetical protein [Xenorhabdus khoisanae]